MDFHPNYNKKSPPARISGQRGGICFPFCKEYMQTIMCDENNSKYYVCISIINNYPALNVGSFTSENQAS